MPTDIVHALPIDKTRFAPFGDLIDLKTQPDMMINAGLCGRHHDLADVAVDETGRVGISLFDSHPVELPLRVTDVERHPLGSQAFIPTTGQSFVVVVAPDAAGIPDHPVAFVVSGGQGINLHRGTWHGVLSPLGRRASFAVIDRIGSGENLELYTYTTEFVVHVDQEHLVQA